MKRYLFIILILFTGCVRDIDKNPGRKMVIGFSQCTMIDEWRKAMVEDMEREITFYRDLNIELIVKDAADNNDIQIADIKELVSKGIDLLIVSPNEAEPLTPTVEKVFSEGIPVIVVDRKINSTKYTAFIGADNLAIGKEAGYFA
jgi:ABC-type sugar transport system substrate-binding protein